MSFARPVGNWQIDLEDDSVEMLSYRSDSASSMKQENTRTIRLVNSETKHDSVLIGSSSGVWLAQTPFWWMDAVFFILFGRGAAA